MAISSKWHVGFTELVSISVIPVDIKPFMVWTAMNCLFICVCRFRGGVVVLIHMVLFFWHVSKLTSFFTWYHMTWWTMNMITCSCDSQWRHNERDGVSNPRRHDCLLDRLFRRRSKETSKLRVTGLCVGNSPVTSEFSAQRASDAENVFQLMTSSRSSE